MLSPDLQRIEHIRDYCLQIGKTILRYGDSFETFKADMDFQQSVAFSVLQIGELCNSLSEEYRKLTRENVEWNAIRGLRNIVAHAYGSIKLLGYSSVEQFQALFGGYTEEQEKLATEIPAKEAAIQKLRDTVSCTDVFIAKAKRYTDITELTPELLRLFIQKIVVHEKSVKYSKYSEQTVEIHYTDIGFIGETGEEEKPQQEITA